MEKRLSDFIDRWGLIQAAGDGGDTCANEGTYWFCQGLGIEVEDREITFSEMLSWIERPAGQFVRHPDTSRWYSEPDRLSSDQARSMLAACAVQGEGGRKAAARFACAHWCRGLLFMTNTRRNGATRENHGQVYKQVDGKDVRRDYSWKLPDVTGPEFWALLIRATRSRWLRWLLPLLDISSLLSAIVSRANLHPDVRNRIQLSVLGTHVWPTRCSKLAAKLYAKGPLIESARAFWGVPWEPPMDVYLEDVVRGYIYNSQRLPNAD